MTFSGFTDTDFDVFGIPGLEPRMDALKAHVRPKLEQLGQIFSPILSEAMHTTVYSHVAKHARRTVNAPNDSWVAFCTDKRGYKKHPHFQIGLWYTHVFATFGLIYESPIRAVYANAWQHRLPEIRQTLSDDFILFPDHRKPEGIRVGTATQEDWVHCLEKLKSGREGELLIGRSWSREEVTHITGEELIHEIETCFKQLGFLVLSLEPEETLI